MSFQKSQFTVVIPFYNEENFLGRTLDSWAEQNRLPDHMILVDNASTDSSWDIAEQFRQRQLGRIKVDVLMERRPGKVYALDKSQQYLEGEWAVFCDADTWYPSHYLQKIEEIAEHSKESVVCIMALDLKDEPSCQESQRTIFIKKIASTIFHDKCHTGGFGQTIRISALRKAGGFGVKFWNFVLMDHEIIYRVHHFGTSRYDKDLWCIPSTRRSDRSRVRWTPFEMFLYFVLPFPLGRWFFYRYLRGQFLHRKLRHRNLRAQPWQIPNLGVAS